MVSRLEQNHEGTPDSMRKSQVTNLYAELGQKKAIPFFSLLCIQLKSQKNISGCSFAASFQLTNMVI